MIPLSSIDFAAVLKGARVPLCVSTRSVERAEWIGDAAYAMVRGAMDFTRLVSTEANQQQLALDPTDPDVARVLDMRIAKRRAVFSFGGADFIDGVVWVLRPHVTDDGCAVWRLHYADGISISGWLGFGMYSCLDAIPATIANIPLARAALIKALYPRKEA